MNWRFRGLACCTSRDDETGQRLEPIEEVTIDVDEPYAGVVIEKVSQRRGEMQDMRATGAGKIRLLFSRAFARAHRISRRIPDRHARHRRDEPDVSRYAPFKGPIEGRRNGVLVSTDDGEAVAYALWYLEERGRLFITPGTRVYQGMIIGENSRDNDLDVNPLRSKQLTNIRTHAKDEALRLTPVSLLTLEQSIAYIEDDELVEVTPRCIRLRKRALLPHLRKKAKEEVA